MRDKREKFNEDNSRDSTVAIQQWRIENPGKRLDLSDADLSGADLPHFQICDGDLIVWGRKNGFLVKMLVPKEAKRTASLIGRKCRAEFVRVMEIEGATDMVVSTYEHDTIYRIGEMVYPDSYDDDVRIECTHGIHFFLTRDEADEWQ